MFDFGDELIINNHRIPWLIWIHLLIVFLFILLLFYGLTFFNLEDHSHSLSSNSPTASSSAAAAAATSSGRSLVISSSLDNGFKVKQNQRIQGETGASTSREIVKSREEIHEIDGFPTKDAAELSHLRYSLHPCNIIGLAKQAFLKCLGLDSTLDNPCRRQRKEKKH